MTSWCYVVVLLRYDASDYTASVLTVMSIRVQIRNLCTVWAKGSKHTCWAPTFIV